MALIWIGAIIVVIVLIASLGRPFVLLLDRVWLSKPLEWVLEPGNMQVHDYSDILEIRELPTLKNVYRSDSTVTVSVNGTAFPLGFSKPNAYDELAYYLFPDSGDVVQMRYERSVIGWWTPFESKVMVSSPTNKRNSYYTLTWLKADGRKLTVRWRMEEYKYQYRDWLDWRSPSPRPDETGLIEMNIVP